MASKTILSPRASNKTERAKRRDEIIKRWHKRSAMRMYEEAISDETETAKFITSILHYSEWVPLLELVRAAPPNHLAVLLAYSVQVIQFKEMPYDEYLATPYWKAKAGQCKRQYDGRCALDDSHEAQHAHHRTYERRGRELDTDLIPLCADCHSKFHGKHH